MDTSRRSAWLTRAYRCDAALAFAHDGIAQDADARDLDFDHIPIFHVLRRPIGAHPQDVARVQRQVLTHAADKLAHAENRIFDGIAEHLLAVEPNRDLDVVGVESSDDPRAHGLEGVGVLAAPERPIAALPGALADVIPNRGAEHI